MNLLKLLTLSIILSISISSCADRIVGKWNIASYKKGKPGNENVTASNIGSMRFKKNKSGEKEINVGILQNNVSDNRPFKWDSTESYLTISGDNSEFSKTWIRVENKRKYQLLKSTDGANNVQELELRK